MVLALHDVVHQFAGNGYFRFGSFTQRYTDGVAQPVRQQGPDAKGRLDASVFAIAGFGHAEVQGEVHAFFLHHGSQQAHGLHHHHRIGGFDGNDHVCEVLFHTDAQELHARLHHAFRCIAVARHGSVGQ